MAVMHVVGVVVMRYGDMAAGVPVLVFVVMVDRVAFTDALIHVIPVCPVDVSVMGVVGVVTVGDGDVTAALAVGV